MAQHNDLPKLAAPAERALAAANIKKLSDLTQWTEAELSKLHGIGPNALKKLNQALTLKGLSFKGKTG